MNHAQSLAENQPPSNDFEDFEKLPSFSFQQELPKSSLKRKKDGDGFEFLDGAENNLDRNQSQ